MTLVEIIVEYNWKIAALPKIVWLRAVYSDLRPFNTGLSSAWRKAANRGRVAISSGHGYAQGEFAMKEEEPNQ